MGIVLIYDLIVCLRCYLTGISTLPSLLAHVITRRFCSRRLTPGSTSAQVQR
ncbi:hypothetical protein OIDMADRAFT_21469 [Oidiodendron maius Zn]|uniref:Uncharacterized protein n=1 Tax=Oidiodendron maius (strain Zn) TaxID=913774 RepID=A0A0C3C4V9_OIDMZ|nr:hypothetical protein OIDMADRAFT_21469 [Oidiodendron maius Zn]